MGGGFSPRGHGPWLTAFTDETADQNNGGNNSNDGNDDSWPAKWCSQTTITAAWECVGKGRWGGGGGGGSGGGRVTDRHLAGT